VPKAETATPPHSGSTRRSWLRLALAVITLVLPLTIRPASLSAQTPGALNVSLTATPTTVTTGRAVTFSLSASPPAVRDGRLTSVVLDYGDGARDDIPGPFGAGERVDRSRDHAYRSPGTYTAILTAAASNGDSNSASQTITVTGDERPIGGLTVTLTASPATVSTRDAVHFDISATPPSVLDGRIVSLVLDFGDGARDDIPGPFDAGQRVERTRDHTYTSPGTYTAILTATASNGDTKNDSQTITVTGGNQPPIGGLVVSLSASPTSVSTGQRVSFSVSATPPSVLGGSVSSLVLDYGDGVQDSIPGPFAAGEQVTRTRDHAYAAPGTYTATLTATASNGDTKSDTQTITVSGGNQPPVGGLTVSLTASPAVAQIGQMVTFTVSASPPSVLGGSIASLTLDFGDGTTADLGTGGAGEQVTRTTTHAYGSPGTYTAVLTATASDGETGSATQTTTVFGGTPPAPSTAVALQPGWNLIAVPDGATISGPLSAMYTYQAGDSGYEAVQNTQSGLGYWAFSATPATETLPLTGPQTVTQPLPPGQWVMLGNPGSTVATVVGADVVYVYSPDIGYQPTTILQPGQGAWVLSLNGGVVTITSP
jgi:PKD repeat protein